MRRKGIEKIIEHTVAETFSKYDENHKTKYTRSLNPSRINIKKKIAQEIKS